MRVLPAAKVVAGGILLALVATSTGPATPPPAPRQELTATVTTRSVVLDAARASLLDLVAKNSSSDQQYMSGGRFHMGQDVSCERCELGPAVASAAYYRRTGQVTFYKIATSAMDTALKQQRKDGSWGKGAPNEDGNTIQTVFFTQHLGAMVYFLGPKLDLARRKTYKAALAKAADALIAKGLTSYYVNGNINSATTVGIGMAWKLTGQARFRAAYEKSITFTMKPPASRWPGFGFRVTKYGALSLARDTKGYLGEKGSGAPGFDPEYASFASDLLAQGYVVLRDPRLLTMSNALLNQLWSRVDTGSWTYDITGGSRQHRTTGRDRFTTSALAVGATFGRTDLQKLLPSQAQATARLMKDSTYNHWTPVYQSWGSQMSTLIFIV